MAQPTRYTEILANGLAGQIAQGEAELDLTTVSDSTVVINFPSFEANDGGDTIIPLTIWAYVTEVVAADATAPVVTIEGDDGTDTGLALTLTDGDAVGDIATATIADGAAVVPVDITSQSMVATVTTAGVDAAAETGKCKVFVQYILVK